MKNKTVFLSAFTAATLLALSIHHGRRLPENLGVHRSKNAPDHRAPAIPDLASSAIGSMMDKKTEPEDATDRSQPTLFAETRVRPSGIPAELLKEARRTAEELAANIEGYKIGISDARYYNQSLNSGNPAKKLSLRLGLDQATAQNVDAVLTSALAEQIKQRIGVEQARMDHEARLLADDRENYVDFLALQSMQSRGSALSEEQKEFCDSFRQKLAPAYAADAPASFANWYDDSKLLETLNRRLPPAKRDGFSEYIEEQRHRDQEQRSMHAQMRANQIAGQLGLSKADQSTLLEYLKESPDASTGELSALLPSELRNLLPPSGL